MKAAQRLRRPVARRAGRLMPLENGENLHSSAFLRRFEAMPEVKKAELVEGTVYMASAVRAELHGKPDSLIQLWLGYYAAAREGMASYTNTTLLLDAENSLQPDAMLCSAPAPGGRVWLNSRGYLCGYPEFVCEVAASTTSLDLHQKLRAYCRNGVSEYLVWLVMEERFIWFALEDGEYLELQEDASGLLKSRIFKGLVLDTRAALMGQAAKVIARLNAAGKR
jgi:Uma2 family endonuclease